LLLHNDETSERDIIMMDSRTNGKNNPLDIGFYTLIRGSNKMMYIVGCPVLNGREYVELNDINADPEEMKDMSSTKPGIANKMLQTIKAKLAEGTSRIDK
jgi:hypothetical protein